MPEFNKNNIFIWELSVDSKQLNSATRMSHIGILKTSLNDSHLKSAALLSSSHDTSAGCCRVLESVSGMLWVPGLWRTSAPAWRGSRAADWTSDWTVLSDSSWPLESSSAKTVGVEQRNEKQEWAVWCESLTAEYTPSSYTITWTDTVILLLSNVNITEQFHDFMLT